MSTSRFLFSMLGALLLFCALNNVLHAQDGMSACIEKARIASQVAHALDEGYPLDGINFHYPAARNAEEVEAAEAVVATIKAATLRHYERLTASDQRAERAAQAYLEECAYLYGKSLRKSASSEKLGDRIMRCDKVLEDEGYINKLLASGHDFAAMRARAYRTFQACEEQHCVGFSLERLDKIQKLIDEAEQSGDVPRWYETKRSACMTGEEV